MVNENVIDFGFLLLTDEDIKNQQLDPKVMIFSIFRGQYQIKSNQIHINKILLQDEF